MATPIGDLVVNLGANTASYERGMVRASRSTKEFVANANAVDDALEYVARSMGQVQGAVSKVALDQATKKFNALKQSVEEVGKSAFALDTFGKNVQRITLNIAAAGTAMAAYAAVAAPFALGQMYEKEFARATAIMGKLAETTKARIRETSFAVAKEVALPAEEVVKGFKYLSEAGFKVEDSLGAIRQMSLFAQAGNMDLARATELAGRSLTAMGLPLSDLRRMTDGLTAANILSQASIEDLASGLTNKLAGSLRLAGKSLEEGIALLAIFANKGVVGEEAGTALSMVIRDLQKAALKSRDGFKEFHDAVYNQYGTMRSMADIIGFLEQKLSTLPAEGQLSLLEQYGFQWKSLHHILTLIGSSDDLRKFVEQVKDVESTESIAKKSADAITRSWNELRASAQNLGNTFVRELAPGLSQTISLLADLLKVSNDAAEGAGKFVGESWFSKLTVDAVTDVWRMGTGFKPGAYRHPGTPSPVSSKPGTPLPTSVSQAEARAKKANQDRLEEELKRREEYAERLKKVLKEQEELGWKILTPIEKYREKVKEVTDLYKHGAIKSLAEYKKVLAPFYEEYINKPAKKAAEEEEERRDKAMKKVADDMHKWAASREAEKVKEREDLLKRGEDLRRSVRTPSEALREKLTEFKDLMGKGAISRRTFGRLAQEASRDFLSESAEKRAETPRFAGAATAGSAEAWSIITGAMNSRSLGVTKGDKEIIKAINALKAILKATGASKDVDIGTIIGGVG